MRETTPLVRYLEIKRYSAALRTVDPELPDEAARCHRSVSVHRRQHSLCAILPLIRGFGPPIPRQIEALLDAGTKEEKGPITILGVAVTSLGEGLPQRDRVRILPAVEEAQSPRVAIRRIIVRSWNTSAERSGDNEGDEGCHELTSHAPLARESTLALAEHVPRSASHRHPRRRLPRRPRRARGRVLHAARVERRAPAPLIVARELRIETLVAMPTATSPMPRHESSHAGKASRADGRSPSRRRKANAASIRRAR